MTLLSSSTPLLSTLVYLLGGTLMLFITLFIYASYRRSRHEMQKYLSVIFFSLAVHAYAFAAPFLLPSPTPLALGGGYILGITFVYLVFLFTIPVMVFLNPGKTLQKTESALTFLVVCAGVISLSLLIIDFRPPISSELGFVIWNTNPIPSWITGLTGLIIGSLWFFSFYENSTLVQEPFLRTKLVLMGTIGLLLGLVALLVYTSESGLQTALGHVLFLLSAFVGLAIYLLPQGGFFEKSLSQKNLSK